MSGKLLVIISTSDPEKARTGAMYGVNALKFGWMVNPWGKCSSPHLSPLYPLWPIFGA